MDEIIQNPWQWEFDYSLTFENGRYDGGIVTSPFCSQAEALAYCEAFLGALEAKCKILGIEVWHRENEISQVQGSECVNEESKSSTLAATQFLADILGHWIRLVNTELCHEEPDEDGFVVKKS